MGPKNPSSNSDERMGPKNPSSNILTDDDEAIVLAYRWRTRLSLNDSYLRLKRFIPQLSRSTLYRCLKRHGLNKIGPIAKCSPLTTGALRGPYLFEITAWTRTTNGYSYPVIYSQDFQTVTLIRPSIIFRPPVPLPGPIHLAAAGFETLPETGDPAKMKARPLKVK